MSALAALAEPADESAGRHRDWDAVVAHAPVGDNDIAFRRRLDRPPPRLPPVWVGS